jgi:hypothetical protein
MPPLNGPANYEEYLTYTVYTEFKCQCTLIKKKIKFFSYKEIQNGAVAKSYMTNGLLIYGEIFARFLIYEEALPHIGLYNCSTLNCLIYEENLFFFFFQCNNFFYFRV